MSPPSPYSVHHYSDDFSDKEKSDQRREYHRAWRAANRDKQKEYKRRWEAKNPEMVKAAQRRKYERNAEKYAALRIAKRDPEKFRAERRAYYAKNKSSWLDRFRIAKYGVTPELYAEMLAEQQGKCPICGLQFDGSPRQEHVDHDHVTGKVRGVLCRDCNLGLGRFKDNPDALASAIRYLASHGKQEE